MFTVSNEWPNNPVEMWIDLSIWKNNSLLIGKSADSILSREPPPMVAAFRFQIKPFSILFT